ncbi:MAG: molybdopterin-dependent oxidoreductase, partial [Alphaproteobacteria bacterium]|nr:molybdopterin-dependent oxidoreductase [Alphaproteobacteria bacterium]
SALKSAGTTIINNGDNAGIKGNPGALDARYHVDLLLQPPLETGVATAHYIKGQLELWAASPAPDMALNAVARATGVSHDNIILHSVFGGGGFEQKLDPLVMTVAAQAALRLKRPVHVFRSRGEENSQSLNAGGAVSRMTGQALPDGRIIGWQAHIAAPPGAEVLRARITDNRAPRRALRRLDGALPADVAHTAPPPYAIANINIEIHPVNLDVPTGIIRGKSDNYTCFFNESFINELATGAGIEPLSFRMGLLGDQPRLAQCLTKAGALAGWQGGAQGSHQGLACHSTGLAMIAVIAEAQIDANGQISVRKLSAVADIGQAINPDVARQQIEGGLMFGLGLALGVPSQVRNGYTIPRKLGQLHLPQLQNTPEIVVDLVISHEKSADAWDLAVPPVAPAVAAALFAGSGRRTRSLPLKSASE